MGKTRGPYKIEFEPGTIVRVASKTFLEAFMSEWRFHHKLESDQLRYHDTVTVVEKAGVYHGGDEIYNLHGVPGIWHEQCLEKWLPDQHPNTDSVRGGDNG